MDEVLVDRGELGGQDLLQDLEDLGVALHATSGLELEASYRLPVGR